MSDAPKSAGPGWYPHPSMAGTQRYWDGSKWTDHVAPLPVAPEPPADPNWTRQRVLGTVLGLAVIVLLFLAYVVRIWG